MSNSKAKTNNVSGFRVAVMIISILALSLIMAFGIILGVSSLKTNGPIGGGDGSRTTVRKETPDDGTLPTDSEAIDNIGYMAYVMDNQQFYHSYAYNSTKSTGYEQVTQSWKDYKSADMSGEGHSVMVASDLSYSALIKSATQSCFIGSEKALIRDGSKPSSKDTKPLELDWDTGEPTGYDKEGYKYVYGEFSTEISVYVIDELSLEGADPVVDNGDGTYSQKYYLNEHAGVWYQYGMKTRGGLKNYPEFKKIEITFTFNEKWEILESYCEETATISPKALGGMNMGSNSKTTTVYNYSEEDFDSRHYAYYDSYFKQYKDIEVGGKPEAAELTALDVLGAGFSKVISEGQQFKLELTLGETVYDGRVYLMLADLSDPLGSIDARVALEKKGSGRQDFYAEFKDGKINVYFSTAFALTADIDGMSTAVNNIIGWVNNFTSKPKQAVKYALTAEEEESSFDIGSLLNDLKLEIKETEAVISLQSEDLLGLGLGIDVAITFDRIVEEDGDLFSIKSVDLDYIDYNGEPVDLKIAIVPDDDGAEIILRQEQAGTNLADYVDSVYKILNSKTIKVDIGLGDKLIEGLSLDATAYLSIGSDIAANVSVSALYKGYSLKLDASYIYVGTYGKIYLHVTEINGTAVDAKVYCDIGDTVSAVESIIAIFGGNDKDAAGSVKASAEAEGSLVAIINKVLNLDFSKVIGKIASSDSTISLDINVDELLKGLDLSLGFNFGTASLVLDSANDRISGNLEDLGLTLDIEGSDADLPLVGNTAEYLDLTLVLQLTEDIINEGKKIAEAEDIVFSIEAVIDEFDAEIYGHGEVIWADNSVKVAVALTLEVDGRTLEINLVYDDTVADDEPLVILTLNEFGTTISRDEIDLLVDTFTGLINSFKDIGTATYSTATPIVPYSDGNSVTVGGKSLDEILANENVKKTLNAIIGFVNEFAVELKTADAEKAIYNLVLSHSDGLKITLGANGGLSLGLAQAGKYGLGASVEAGNGTTVADMRSTLLENSDDYLELSEFVKAVYGAFFDSFEDISLKKLLGDGPYIVTLNLSGKNSEISALEGVEVYAELYYGEGVVGTQRETKLVQANLNLNIDGTTAKITAAYRGHMLFVELNNIGATTFTGIKFKADVNNVFDLAEMLVRLVTDTNLVETINRFMGNGAVSASDIETLATFAAMTGENGTPAPSTLTKLLDALLSLNLEESFKLDKESHTAEINLDSISEAMLGVKIGTVTALFDGSNKVLNATAQLEGRDAWLSLVAAPFAGDSRKYEINPDNYTDINFVKTLISDLEKTAVDSDKKFGTLYTFTGSINVKILSVLTVDFKDTKLTLGLDSDEKFYVSLTASLESGLLSNSKVCFTYADGLIVLGRDINGSSAQYKVVTMDYLLDNLFVGDEIFKWYLGINGLTSWIWGLIQGALNFDISSGLTTPKEYALYEELTQLEAEGTFNLGDYLSGMFVNADGNTSTFGNGASFAKKNLTLNGDYYAFDINADVLTDGVLSGLCAAIMRDGVNGGISGLQAYGAIDSFVKFTLDLGEFKGSDPSIAALNYLQSIDFDRNYNDFEGGAAHTTPKFGGYDTASKEYSSSDVLDTIYLDVYSSYESMLAGVKPERTLKVVYGSTVHLIRENFPDIVNGKKLSYVGKDGEPLAASIIIDDNHFDLSDFRVSICKSLSDEDAVEVNLNFINISTKTPVIGANSFALRPDEKIADYELNNYNFLGWYSDENLTNRVTYVSDVEAVNSKITIYGAYIKSEFREENGVNYTFDYKYWQTTGEFIYYVSGINENIINYYKTGGKYANDWLEIAAEINGYPVTYIAAGAFKREDETDNEKAANSLVNVLVPDSVIAVYEEAFAYNKSLQKVVFCADAVFFGGKLSDKNTVFYGCHPGNDPNGDYKDFKLYYNGTRNNPYTHVSSTTSVDGDWDGIFYAWYVLVTYRYKMDTISSGWNFVDYTVNTDGIDLSEYSYLKDLNLFVSGLNSTRDNADYFEYTTDYIREQILKEINRRTIENDRFINGFDVVVTISGKDAGKTVFGKYSEVTIKIVERSDRAYMVNSHAAPDERAAYVSGLEEYDGNYYATAGEKYYIVIDGDYEFVSASGVSVAVEDGKYYFIMPYGYTEIEIVCNKLEVTQITLISDISFTYEGTLYDTLEDGKYKAEIGVPEGSFATPVADSSYTFLGWAYPVGENSYAFVGEEIESSVYYAVWAFKRTEITNLSTDGLTLTATVDSSKASSVYGWYADADFSGTALALCDGSNAAAFDRVSSTIVYARLVYSYSYAMSGGSMGENKYYVTEDNSQSSTTSANGSFTMLEGTELKYSWAEGEAGKVLKVDFVDKNGNAKTLYFRIVYAFWNLNPTTNAITLGGSVSNNDVTNGKSIIVESNLSMSIKI